jgi:hypothetical protein
MANIQPIPFYDDTLYAIVDERTGKEYVLPKPMVDIFGLRWHGQLAKLSKNKLFSKGIQKICIPTSSGEQETILLERRLVHAWLLSIDVNRVRPESQEKLLRYQEECAQVLDNYFHEKTMPVTRGDLLVQMAEAYRAQERRLLAVEGAQQAQQREIIAGQSATIEAQRQAIEALQQATQADAKSEMALANQQWLTIREYVYLNTLQRQMAASACKAYGTYLTGYCLENGIPVRDQGVADRQWGTEHAYHIEAIADTLPGWLARRESQTALRVVQPSEHA